VFIGGPHWRKSSKAERSDGPTHAMAEIAAVHRPQTQSNDISKSGNGFARIPRRKECWGMGRWRWGDWLFWTAAGVFFFALDVGAYLLYEHWSHPPEPASRSAVSPRHAPALQSVEAEQAAAVARANVQSVAQDRHPGVANPIPVHAVRPLDA